MKIAVLTYYYNSVNYGGVLQSYALCETLKKMGASCEQIQYDTAPYIQNTINIKKGFIQYILKECYSKVSAYYFRKRYHKFKLFRDKISHSKVVYSDYNISDSQSIYDLFIVGSDQVWNPDWYRPAFFLDFIQNPNKKISYAASIAKDRLTDEQIELFRDKLNKFSAISVREDEAEKLLSRILNINIETVLDPTLLLNRTDWDKVCSKRLIKEPYVYSHFIGDDPEERAIAYEFAKKENIKLVTLKHPSRFNRHDFLIDGYGLINVGPEDFISLIKHAELIFTDSFHCCAISSIYHKQFWAFQRLGKHDMASRIYTLLRYYNAIDHFCDNTFKYNYDYIKTARPIDYSNGECLEKMKERSISFLHKSIILNSWNSTQ